MAFGRLGHLPPSVFLAHGVVRAVVAAFQGGPEALNPVRAGHPAAELCHHRGDATVTGRPRKERPKRPTPQAQED